MKRREIRSAIIRSGIVRFAHRKWLQDAARQIFGQRIATHQFEPRLGAISTMQKDLGFAWAIADEVRSHTPLLSLARSLYLKAATRPHIGGAADISTIVGLFEPRDTCSTSS
jgi:3-hydroxyisobutyrate dehydrogenase-like beta-hydroxyacid dehydrogenase